VPDSEVLQTDNLLGILSARIDITVMLLKQIRDTATDQPYKSQLAVIQAYANDALDTLRGMSA
jgi:hypothetical protein